MGASTNYTAYENAKPIAVYAESAYSGVMILKMTPYPDESVYTVNYVGEVKTRISKNKLLPGGRFYKNGRTYNLNKFTKVE